MSRNEERLMSNPAASVENDSGNELEIKDLDFIISTSFVKLPSCGAFYPETHPLHNQNNVEIKEMTAADEDILSNMSYWENGVGFEKFVNHILVNKEIKYVDLLYIDAQAIIIQSRRMSLGNVYSTMATCPNCQKQSLFEVDLEKDLKMTVGTMENLTEDEKNAIVDGYFITLPKTKLIFESRPMLGRDEKKLFNLKQKANKIRGESEAKAVLVDVIATSIKSISFKGKKTENRAKIKEMISQIPSSDSMFLRELYGKIFPSVELKGLFSCSHCKYEKEMEAPFDVNFFFPTNGVF